MEIAAILQAKKDLERALLKLMDDFELKTDCKIDGITIKRRRIEAGIATRDALDKIVIKASLPELE